MQWNELKSHLRHISVADQKRVQQAFELGKEAHEGQKRRSGEPYFTHPIAVTHILADLGADADTLIAGLLHDTVEDTDLTLKDIDKMFDGDVAALIDGVTKLEAEDVSEHPTLDEQIETLRKTFTVLEQDVRVMVIKLVDRLHNMQTVEHLSPERQKSMAKETLEVFVKIADRLSMQVLRDELEGLCLATLHPAEFKKLNALQEKNEKKSSAIIRIIEKKLSADFPSVLKDSDIVYERKSWGKLGVQLASASEGAGTIPDSVISFICHDVQECYEILGALHQIWNRVTLSFQDYINVPMINGYRGLHTTIILEDGTRVRCKIRTEEMYDYAKEGIATMCFDDTASGLLDYILPWTERINTLSEGTKDHSDAFWENLQRDILGDSIVMHGPHDEQIMLPKEATALDGVFYLYQNRALRCKEIFVNGKPVEFFEPLPNACTVTATFAKQLQANLDWLQKVNTGIAATHIREGLSKAPESSKKVLGKELLESTMMKEARVSIDELDATVMKQQILQSLGMKSLEEVYIQLAEGKIQAENIISILFPRTKKAAVRSSRTKRWTLKMSYLPKISDSITVILRNNRPKKVVSVLKGDSIHMRAKYYMTDEEAKTVRQQLRTVLPKDQWVLYKTWRKFVLIGALVLLIALWGMDPVWAKLLLNGTSHVNPFDLTIIRFASFFVVASLFHGSARLLYKRAFKPLSPLHPTLILSGVALFLTGLFTYITLSLVHASQYILFIVAALVAFALIKNIESRLPIWHLLVAIVLLAVALTITTLQIGFSYTGALFATGSALGFVLYSQVSMRYQQEIETIQARYPAYLFWLSTICLPLALLLLPASTVHTLSNETLLLSVAYVVLFSIVPYGIYFECMRRFDRVSLDRSLPFVCLWTFGGDVVLEHSLAAAYSIPILILATLLLRFGGTKKADT